MSERTEVMVAAYRRGIPITKIAEALGVSYQAVGNVLKRVGAEKRKRRYPQPSREVPRFAMNCRQCGTVWWGSDYELRHERAFYCSAKCHHIAASLVSDDDIMKVVEMRQSGMSWKIISKKLGITTQALQKRLWVLLARNGNLVPSVVYPIWGPLASEFRKKAKWNWLENSTGFTLTNVTADGQGS